MLANTEGLLLPLSLLLGVIVVLVMVHLGSSYGGKQISTNPPPGGGGTLPKPKLAEVSPWPGAVIIVTLIAAISLGVWWKWKDGPNLAPVEAVSLAKGCLDWDELIATREEWSRPIVVPRGCKTYIHEDGDGWVELPNGEVKKIGPDILVTWPEIPGGQFRFKAKNRRIKVKMVWEKVY